MFTLYEVGGKVRDEILGLKSKDVDYTVVPTDELILKYTEVDDMFSVLIDFLKREGYELFLVTPDCYTIRANFPKGHKFEGLVADCVMARKEIGYIEGTRKPILKPGTLYDDLIRRDFTVNAIAKDSNGDYIDYFDGMCDLDSMVLRTPLNCRETFDDDPLRILRAIRFSITKGFHITGNMAIVIEGYDYESKMGVVSVERIREELFKCFKENTLKTISLLNEFPALRDYVFKDNLLWLKPTLEK
jgi:tRNA nucleotidyltransferase/poly(A) polymerase